MTTLRANLDGFFKYNNWITISENIMEKVFIKKLFIFISLTQLCYFTIKIIHFKIKNLKLSYLT